MLLLLRLNLIKSYKMEKGDVNFILRIFHPHTSSYLNIYKK